MLSTPVFSRIFDAKVVLFCDMTKYIDQKRGFGEEIVIQIVIAMLVEVPIPLM